MDKRFIVILAIVVLAIGGLFIFTSKKDNKTNTTTSTTASVSNHTEGNTASKVHLVVYGDFQCSACESFFPIETQVLQKYLSQITFTFRHFPIESLHPNALAASRAAEAAGLQGKFFKMHDLLYQYQSNWENLSDPVPYFNQLAGTLGVNMTKFKTDFASEAVNNTILADMKDGTSKGIDGTPTYVLNGTKLNNQDIDSLASFSAKIDQALKATASTKSS